MYGLVFVPPVGIQVEESLQIGKAGQRPSHVVPVHMGTDGHRGGGRSFVAPLNLATINPLSGPMLT